VVPLGQLEVQHTAHLLAAIIGSLTQLYGRTVYRLLLATRRSIEDPFETHYDVAHVVKGAQMAYLRKEFLVSTCIGYTSLRLEVAVILSMGMSIASFHLGQSSVHSR